MREVSRPDFPLSPDRARQALAADAAWHAKHTSEQPFGWGFAGRDVGAELTAEEHFAVSKFLRSDWNYDGPRWTFTDVVEACLEDGE